MPRRRRIIAPFLVLTGGLVLAGCDLGDDGPQATRTRDVPAFTRIDNRDSVDLHLRAGERQRLEVRAGDKVIDDVRTEVRDGTLQVSFDRDRFGTGNVVVEATVARLSGVHASGSGDVDVDGIEADTFEVSSDGSADISLEGRVGRLAVDLDGSGDARLGRLTAREARVAVAGSGDAEVRADRRLDVVVDGSGDVRYSGDPELTSRVDGSGELRRSAG